MLTFELVKLSWEHKDSEKRLWLRHTDVLRYKNVTNGTFLNLTITDNFSHECKYDYLDILAAKYYPFEMWIVLRQWQVFFLYNLCDLVIFSSHKKSVELYIDWQHYQWSVFFFYNMKTHLAYCCWSLEQKDRENKQTEPALETLSLTCMLDVMQIIWTLHNPYRGPAVAAAMCMSFTTDRFSAEKSQTIN